MRFSPHLTLKGLDSSFTSFFVSKIAAFSFKGTNSGPTLYTSLFINISYIISYVMQGILPISNQNYYYQKVEQTVEKTKVWIAAHRALTELVASLAFNVALISFVANPISYAALSIAATNFLVGSVVQMAYSLWKDDTLPGQHIARTSTAFTIGRAYPQIAIHESGHALMASSCFQNAKPKITITPFRGGMTSYTVSNGLTALGNLLGKERALVLISASGIMATTVFAMISFAIADKLQDHYPTVASCLNYEGVAFIMSEVLYGLTAFIASKEDLTHDFIYMWQKGGIHPLIPIALMITLPLLEKQLLKMRRESNASQKGTSI